MSNCSAGLLCGLTPPSMNAPEVSFATVIRCGSN